MFTLHPQENVIPPFAVWNDGFSEIELASILSLGASSNLVHATIDKNTEASPEVRNCLVSWLTPTQDSAWLFERIAFITNQLNSMFFRFDLSGIYENLQYTVYEGAPDVGGHYTWHMDRGNTGTPRKLSLVLQLSPPDEYEGGELEVLVGNTPTSVEKKLGLVAAFPGYVLHRVTPVTKGIRRTLVVWISGPAFR